MTKSTKYYYDVWDKSGASSTVLDAVFDKLDSEDLYYTSSGIEFEDNVAVYRERCSMWIRQLIRIREALDTLKMEEKENEES